MYSSRKIKAVEFGGFNCFIEDAVNYVNTRVYITLTGPDENVSGPTIDFQLGFELDAGRTVQSIQDEALDRAHALLQRVASESIEDLRKSFSQNPYSVLNA